MSGQEGPVEPGQPPVIGMDLDRAIRWFHGMAVDHPGGGRADLEIADQAQAALQALTDRARAYVKGPTSGRLAALAQVLQEPVPDEPRPVTAETVAQAWLTDRGMVAVRRDVLERLGIAIS